MCGRHVQRAAKEAITDAFSVEWAAALLFALAVRLAVVGHRRSGFMGLGITLSVRRGGHRGVGFAMDVFSPRIQQVRLVGLAERLDVTEASCPAFSDEASRFAVAGG